MKITKSQLKQIIREELLKEAHPRVNTAINLLEGVMRRIAPVINDAYDRLGDPESQQTFERYLNENVRLMTQKWQEERGSVEAPAEEEEPIGRGFEGWASRNPSATGAE